MAGAVSFSGVGVKTAAGRIEALTGRDQFLQRIRRDAFPPIMSYFEPEKRTSSGPDFIERQRARFAEQVKQAEKVVIVGVRVHPLDRHIWEPLATTNARLVYCAGQSGGREFADWARSVARPGHDRVMEDYFADCFAELLQELSLG